MVIVRIGTGDIPALTGEPVPRDIYPTLERGHPRTYGGTDTSQAGVCPSRGHPRTYGGTDTIPQQFRLYRGTSPHLRGNRIHPVKGCGHLGDIPALTGEPARPRDTLISRTGHPRTYGGTSGQRHYPLGG